MAYKPSYTDKFGKTWYLHRTNENYFFLDFIAHEVVNEWPKQYRVIENGKGLAPKIICSND